MWPKSGTRARDSIEAWFPVRRAIFGAEISGTGNAWASIAQFVGQHIWLASVATRFSTNHFLVRAMNRPYLTAQFQQRAIRDHSHSPATMEGQTSPRGQCPLERSLLRAQLTCRCTPDFQMCVSPAAGMHSGMSCCVPNRTRTLSPANCGQRGWPQSPKPDSRKRHRPPDRDSCPFPSQ